MTQPLVTVQDLRIGATTDAGRQVEIIKGVSFDIAPGEVIALIGESGSGKTTIALSLMGHTRTGCRIDGGRGTDRRDSDHRLDRERARAGAWDAGVLCAAVSRRRLQSVKANH